MSFTCAECHDKTDCDQHGEPFYKTGKHPAFSEATKVFQPSILGNISVGRCEDCKKTRPCVDCHG